MKGTLYLTGNKWRISYWEGALGNQEMKHLDLHPESVEEFKDQLADNEFIYQMNGNIEFKIVKKFLANETEWMAKIKPSMKIDGDIKDHRIESAEEDLECAHLYLDDRRIPRTDKHGEKYSLVGRIKRLESSIRGTFNIL